MVHKQFSIMLQKHFEKCCFFQNGSEYVSADRKGQTMTDERLESHGGARENAGRKAAPKGSRRRSVTVTDYEYNYIQNWLKTHRESQDE